MEAVNANGASGALELISLLLLGTALGSVLVRRLHGIIALLAGQGLLLAAAAAVVAGATGSSHLLLAPALTLVVKVLAVPGLLLYALREVRLKREIETVIPQKVALVLAVGLVLVAYNAVGPFAEAAGLHGRHALPAAVSMLLIGLFNMLVRKKALSQVAGLVAMENGLYLAAVVAIAGVPLAIELGVAVDLVVGVLVMGILTREIHRTFNSINTDQLRALRG